MRSRPTTWVLICLLLVAVGGWLFWQRGNRVTIRTNPTPAQKIGVQKNVVAPNSIAAKSVSTAPVIFPQKIVSTNSVQTVAKKKNPFAYRLSNTTETIGKLMNDSHAILLANAFIDTSAKQNFSIPKNLQSQGDPGAYIVQANGPIDAAFRATLAAAGAQIVSYIPNNAYLVRASGNVVNEILQQPGVQTAIAYEPYYKISSAHVMVQQKTAATSQSETNQTANPTLLELAVNQKPLPAGTDLKLGLFADDATATIQHVEKLGGKVLAHDVSPFGPVVFVQPPTNWTALAQLSGVQIVEPAPRRAEANDLARVTLGISADTQTTTNYMNLSGNNVLVEMNDTGVDANHPDFDATTNGGPTRVIGDSALSLVDTNGHGTHVAGIIAGNGLESTTVSNAQGSINPGVLGQYRGKAPLADLYSVAFLDANGNSFGVPDSYLQETPANTNALISNNSWVNTGDETYDLSAASYDAAVRDALPEVMGSQPVLFVFAAGNDGGGDDNGGGGNSDTIDSPGTAKDVITVGALEQLRNITNIVTDIHSNQSAIWGPQTSSSSQVAGYSSRGNVGVGTEGAFGRFKPDVVAPGSFVISTRSGQWDEAAYYNPTNFYFQELDNQVINSNSTANESISLNFSPPNTTFDSNVVGVVVQILPNADSPNPFPNLLIYVSHVSFPDPNDPATYDFVTANNEVSIPPDSGGAITGIQSIQGGNLFLTIANTNNELVNFNFATEIITTNQLGNYFQVLSNLNDSIGGGTPPYTGGYYRYESGTSMAAPAISGVLALMQDYFTNTLAMTPSPALLKAMLINGSRPVGTYTYAITNDINFEGWGLPYLPYSIPQGITNQLNAGCSEFFLDQSPTNALATGDSHTFLVSIQTNAFAEILPLEVTLAWTDPPGDPAAAIKLVNNLDLVVTNMDTGDVYFGNDIASGSTFNSPWNTNSAPNLDSINNIENVIIPPLLGGNYSVTVVGRDVNVNAVTAQTNNSANVYAPNVVQDFALVISCGEGEISNAITVTDGGVASNPTSDQDITFVTETNTPLLNQFVGANTPLLGTNQVPIGSTNEVVTLGMTNQWHFYVVTNNALDSSGSSADVTNAAFITFEPDTLSIPRMGVYQEDNPNNATRPEADIDLYVSTSPALTNLDPTVISNCVNGTQIGASSAGPTFNGASLSGGGTEFVVDTNSTPGQVYYVGVKSEDQNASEYAFLPVFTSTPFSVSGPNGEEIVNGLLLPVAIPDGSPALPGTGYVFGLAIQPMEVQNVVVGDQIVHQNFGDLIGTLAHNDISDVLNNHDSLGPGTFNFIYDDSGSGEFPGSQPSDGPGSLRSFTGTQAVGPWILAEVDDALGATGSVTGFQLTIQPHLDLTGGRNISIAPNSWFYDYVDVPAGYTNLTVSATNLDTPPVSPSLQMFVKMGSQPTTNNYDETVVLNNPGLQGPGGTISIGPPLQPGRYYIGIYNPSASTANVHVIATLAFSASAISTVNFTPTNSTPIIDDAVTYSSIFVTNTDIIQSLSVGLRVDHPRISDLVFHLISPDGTRYLLMENRGGTSTNGCGLTIYTTNNIANFSNSGTTNASTNSFVVNESSGTLPISWNFYDIPDQMTVYDTTNNFIPANLIFNTGMTNGVGQVNLPFTTTSGALTIIMNQFGNPNGTNGDAWTYTAGGVSTNYIYLNLTDDTNLATIPIKFAPPPFVPNLTVSNSIPSAPTNISTLAGPILNPATGHYYYLLPTASWTSSETNAKALGGNLATINDAAENQWVANTFYPVVGDGGSLWIGYYDPSQDLHGGTHASNFVWVDGETVMYNYWLSGEPDNTGGTEFYTSMRPDVYSPYGSWNDLPNDGGGSVGSIFGIVEVVPQASESISNLYYRPEESILPLNGTSAQGLWQLEIQDDRAGAGLTNSLLSWDLQFTFANTNLTPSLNIITLTNMMPYTNSTPLSTNGLAFYQVNVPPNADYATNILLYSTDGPLNVWWSTNYPPTAGQPNDVLLLSGINATNILGTNGSPANITPPAVLIPGSTYYLVVQNPNSFAVTNYALEVDFHLIGQAYAYTEPATLVTGTNAQLNGFATPNGYPSVAWFQWGTNTLYGNNTTPVNVGNGYGVVFTTNQISSLTTNVAYHFRLVVSNALGTVYGFDQILDEANVIPWGANYAGQLNVPTNLNNVTAIAGAYDHNLAIGTNALVTAWGDNTFGQTTVPTSLSNAVAVAGGQYYSLALKSDGTVTNWGSPILNQLGIPTNSNNSIVEIAGGTYCSLALQNNGNVIAWGANFFGLTNVPDSAAMSNDIVAISGGSYHNLALKNDGTVIAWGDDSAGQTNIPPNATNVVAIAAGGYHNLALRSDGTVVTWGDDSVGQTNIPVSATNIMAIAAGGFHSMALTTNGTIVTWGDDSAGQLNVPVGLTNAVAIAAGYLDSLVLTPQFLLNSTTITVLPPLTPGVAQTNSILPGSITYYPVNVPTNADISTNSLLFAQNGPLNIWFTTNTPPTLAATNATLLIAGTNDVSILYTNGTPALVPGSTYYLGVQNTNTVTVNYAIEVDFHLVTVIANPPPTNSFPISITPTNGGFLLTWYAPTDDLFLVQETPTLSPPNWQSFSNVVSYPTFPYVPPPAVTNGIGFFEFFDDGSQFPFVDPLRFYRLILLTGVSGEAPQTNTVAANSIDYFAINVPTNADVATNLLSFASAPVNLLFNQTNPPNGLNAGDFTLLTNSTGGSTNLTLAGSPRLISDSTYYLGVQNTNNFAVTFSLQVNFHLTASGSSITNPVSISGITFTNGGFFLKWFAPSNDIFQVQWTPSLAPASWQTFSNFISYDVAFFNNDPTNTQFDFFDDGAQTGGLSSPRFYRLLLVGSSTSAQTNTVPISSVTTTNIAGMNDFLLTWFAPTNDSFEVQWTPTLAPPSWGTFSNIISYDVNFFTNPTNTRFDFLDNGSQTGGTNDLMRFYRLILLP